MLQSCSSSSSDNNSNSNDNNSNSAVTDIEGNTYQTVSICDQTWTKSNLNVSHYRNGDLIPHVTDLTQWPNLTTGAWCYYQNNSANGPIYGKLYNWYAVTDPRGIAPQGWHVPNRTEVQSLIYCLGGEDVAGGKMKSITTLWRTPNLGANNSSGFTSLPGGTVRSGFSLEGRDADYWTTSVNGTNSNPVAYTNTYNLTNCYTYTTDSYAGFSIRCIKD